MVPYQELVKLGEGTFGQVFRAKETQTGRVVALKFIEKDGRSDQEIRLLNREVTIMKRIHHPNIVTLFSNFEMKKYLVFVMEYAGGSNLLQALQDRGTFPEHQVQRFACQLLSACHYLHSRHIIHRDVKTANAVLGDDGVVKLCDFGFARVLRKPTMKLTSQMGTPAFMSPERLKGEPYDHTADLWALGCTLFELHTGELPFLTESIHHLKELVLEGAVDWPNNMSASCKSFLRGLLTRDPQERLSWPLIMTHPFVDGGVWFEDSDETETSNETSDEDSEEDSDETETSDEDSEEDSDETETSDEDDDEDDDDETSNETSYDVSDEDCDEDDDEDDDDETSNETSYDVSDEDHDEDSDEDNDDNDDETSYEVSDEDRDEDSDEDNNEDDDDDDDETSYDVSDEDCDEDSDEDNDEDDDDDDETSYEVSHQDRDEDSNEDNDDDDDDETSYDLSDEDSDEDSNEDGDEDRDEDKDRDQDNDEESEVTSEETSEETSQDTSDEDDAETSNEDSHEDSQHSPSYNLVGDDYEGKENRRVKLQNLQWIPKKTGLRSTMDRTREYRLQALCLKTDMETLRLKMTEEIEAVREDAAKRERSLHREKENLRVTLEACVVKLAADLQVERRKNALLEKELQESRLRQEVRNRCETALEEAETHQEELNTQVGVHQAEVQEDNLDNEGMQQSLDHRGRRPTTGGGAGPVQTAPEPLEDAAVPEVKRRSLWKTAGICLGLTLIPVAVAALIIRR